MGLFDFFGSKSTSNKVEVATQVPWEELKNWDQLGEIVRYSHEKPVVIFKHSTRCGVSSMVLRSFENHYNLEDGSVRIYYLDLLAHRDLSNEVAMRFQVIHQSPQILVIKNGQTVYHASHHSIHAQDLEALVE